MVKDTTLAQTKISEIIKWNRQITADTALRFSKYFGTTTKFWLRASVKHSNCCEVRNKKSLQ
jgi:addiction module HigA family antidote